MKIQKPAIWILRLGFGGLLLAASIPKILNPLLFAQAVDNYRVIGEDLSRWAAVLIPWLEAATGLLLITGFWLDAAVTINASLMTAFLILVAQAWIRGLDIACGCFEVEGGEPISWLKILENIGFAFGAMLLVFLTFTRKSSSGKTGKSSRPAN